MKRSAPFSLESKDITRNNIRDTDKKYFHKFTEYYLNQNKNSTNFNNKRHPNSSVKDNYYNYLNDENTINFMKYIKIIYYKLIIINIIINLYYDRYMRNIYKSQKKNEDRLNMSVNLLNDRIKNSPYKTPLKNDYNIYYRKNRSFATVFFSIENNKTEEDDYITYKNYKKEYENFE